MTKEEKQNFLENGGILMRLGTAVNGSPCIQWSSLFLRYGEFHTLVFNSSERAEQQMNFLATSLPHIFQID